MVNELFLFLHVFSAIILVGAMHFAVTSLGPLARRGGEEERKVVSAALDRFRKLAIVAALLLFATGGHLAANTGHLTAEGSTTATLALLKVGLALALLAVGVLAFTPGNTAEGGRGSQRLLRLGLVLALLVVGLGTYLTTHRPS